MKEFVGTALCNREPEQLASTPSGPFCATFGWVHRKMGTTNDLHVGLPLLLRRTMHGWHGETREGFRPRNANSVEICSPWSNLGERWHSDVDLRIHAQVPESGHCDQAAPPTPAEQEGATRKTHFADGIPGNQGDTPVLFSVSPVLHVRSLVFVSPLLSRRSCN